MSILNQVLDRARTAGIDPAGPVTIAGMDAVLHQAENLGLLVFKPGMAEDWLASLRLHCAERDLPERSFQELAAAVLQLSVDAEGWIRPRQLWTALDARRRRMLDRALAGAVQPAPPRELSGSATADTDYRDYAAVWRRVAAHTGDAATATAAARKALGLPATPAQTLPCNPERPRS